jgi:hypothetical protein
MNNFSDKVSFIWSVADLLRGPYKPPQYGRVILPLVVLRRLDCVLARTKDKLLAKYDSLKGTKVEHIDPILNRVTGVSFHNTSKLDFDKLKGEPDKIAANLTRYIKSFSSKAREIFEYFGFETEIAKLEEADRLYLVVSKFCDIEPLPGELEHADRIAQQEHDETGIGNRYKGIVSLPDQPQLKSDLQSAIRGVGAARETVKAAVSNVADVLTKAFPVEANALRRTFGGQEAVPENYDQAKAILRGASNEARNEHAGVMKLLDSTKEAFESMPRDEQLEFQRSMYEGQPARNPELKPIADQLYQIANERRQQLSELGVDAAKGWEDQHWNMLWKKTPGTESRPARIGGAGALGGRTGANLLQGRSLESFDQGIEAGLEPKNLNPIQQFAETDAAQRRWISMGRAIRNLSDLDHLYRADPAAEQGGETQRPDDGHVDITNLIPQSLRSLVGDPESGERIYAAPELSQLIHNMVTPSWFEGGAIRRGFREAIRRTNNFLTQIALGVSGFHLKKTFLLEQPAMTLAEGRPISLMPGEGLPGRAGRAEAIQNSMLGLSDMLDPGSRRVVDALRTQMTAEHEPWYDNNITTNWAQTLQQLDAHGVMKNLVKTPFAASQAVTQDLIFKSVQRAKVVASAITVTGPAWTAWHRQQSARKKQANAAVSRIKRQIETCRKVHGLAVVKWWTPRNGKRAGKLTMRRFRIAA